MLTDAQIAEYHERGFIVLRNVFPLEEIERLRELQTYVFEHYQQLFEDLYVNFLILLPF